MKIISVDVILTAAGWRNFLFVKIKTDSGLVGWGEGTLGWKETAVREVDPGLWPAVRGRAESFRYRRPLVQALPD